MSDVDLSVIIPVYGSRASLVELTERIAEVFEQLDERAELIYVDDRCPQDSWTLIEELSERFDFLKGLRLSRNFGQHKAILAGLANCSGAHIVVMDCDLQENPRYIVDLLAECKKGYDIVYTWKTARRYGAFKNITAFVFHTVSRVLSNKTHYRPNVGTLSLITRKVADAYLSLGDRESVYLITLGWLGFSSSLIKVEHKERKHGRSSYTFKKLLKHALQIVIHQSQRLLYFSIFWGFFITLCASLAILWLVINWYFWGYQQGWTSLIVAIAFCTGNLMFGIGVNGLYLGGIFDQAKQLPAFVIDEKLGYQEQA
jgi:polyisoprenyl-phosphate glycosyltransferase